jgi:hypothetical protein
MAARDILRDAADRKPENVRRRKRRDLLRLQLVRLLQVAMFRGTLPLSGCIDPVSGQLKNVMIELIDNARQCVESDQDRDTVTLTSLRLHFCKMISQLISSVPGLIPVDCRYYSLFSADRRRNLIPNDKKQSLFFQLMSWCSRSIAGGDRKYVMLIRII